jgi:D-tyrosyl-tRNA(Tyr) deacylase
MGDDDSKSVKLVIQQCVSARLKPPDGADDLVIGAGMVVFVCFTRAATEESAIRAAETVSKMKLCEQEEEENAAAAAPAIRTSVLEKPGDMLIVPQATLGGKLKGSRLQYHGNVDKASGETLFAAFCGALRALSRNHPKTSEKCKVLHGVYGARQMLSLDATQGPYTHAFQI